MAKVRLMLCLDGVASPRGRRGEPKGADKALKASAFLPENFMDARFR